MQNRPTFTNSRKWQRYNRWRCKYRALDKKLRQERINAKLALESAFSDYRTLAVSIPRKPAALATVIIRLSSGERSQFSIHATPFGLSVSATAAGKRVAAAIAAMLKQ